MSGRTRVAVVVTRAEAGAGGVAVRGATVLDPEHYDVVVCAAGGGRDLAAARSEGLRTVELRHLRPELRPWDDLAALRELTEVLGGLAPEVVHTHSAKAGVLGRLAASRLGVPAIVHTLHGFPFHEFQSWPRRRAYVEVERRLGRLTDCTLAVGSAVAAQAVRLGLAAPGRIRTIGPAVEAGPRSTGASSRAAARRSLGVPPGTRVVGTVGRLSYQKCPEDFVDAIRRLDRRDVLGVWVGDGPELPRIQRLIARRGLADRLQLLGHRDDVAHVLPAFDVFAMTSRYEGLPCAVIEAMSCGLPVVATAVNAVPDVVVPGETGLLVPPRRPDLLAAALDHLLDAPREAARMAAAGQASLGDRFTVQELGRVLAETYSHCLATTPEAREALPAVGTLTRRTA